MGIEVTIRTAEVLGNGNLRLRYDFDEGLGGGVFTGNGFELNPTQLTDQAIQQFACFANQFGVLYIFIAWWKARSATFANTALVINKTMIADLSNNNPIRVQ